MKRASPGEVKRQIFLDHGSERGQGKGRKIAGLRVALDVSKHLSFR